MKKILLSITYFIACTFYIKAQVLFGITPKGGNDNGGTIIEFIPATNNLIAVKSFETIACNPGSNLIHASDGKLYGMTPLGGSSNGGVIFSFDPSTFIYKKLKDFDFTTGGVPLGGLVQATNGKLYGMTTVGGSMYEGVIFSFDPSTETYTRLMDFNIVNGSYPGGSLVQAKDGKLYGTTPDGGSNGGGNIFSFDPVSSTFKNLEGFDFTNGYAPVGSLIQASDGKLYGATTQGGSSGGGVIFSFDPSTSTYAKLKDFDYTNDSDGAIPQGSLVQASDGKLYGMTGAGGINDAGVMFSFDPSTFGYTKLKDFDNTNGGNPNGSLMQASDGKLYGTTPSGGINNVGVIFSFDPSTSTYTKLRDFDKINGGNSYGSLMEAGGKLYGMTSKGGIGDYGVIFSFELSTFNYTLLKQFGNSENGRNVSASLMEAGGKLYGMTNSGGRSDAGVIFSFDPSSSTYTKLNDFDVTNGSNPDGSLMQASDGKLYGMTHQGGSKNAGVIFSFDPVTFTNTKLKDFDSTNGGFPSGSLIQANDGKLYGMTNSGGRSNAGVIFSFDPSSFTYTKLNDFDVTNGSNPDGNLIQASNGKLYGMTYHGGSSGNGVIFSFDPSTSTYSKLKDFDNTNGGNPYGSLIQATNGKLYGMTNSGGSTNGGIIFSFDPSTSTYTKLRDFDYTSGHTPYGSLMQAGDGKLYGMTYWGGANNVGVIFSFAPSTSTYTKLRDFDNANGANPYIGSVFIEVPESGPVPVTLISFKGKNNGNTNELTWKVDNEQNLYYYQLQRSIDAQNFSGISQIKATGNSTYIYNDQISVMTSSFYYYRLKSVDNDGKFKYSDVIKIRADLNGKFAIVNPNPFKDRLMITVQSLTQDEATFIITDVSGRQLYKEIKLLSPGTNIVQINEGKLSKGTYLLTIIKSQQTQGIKVIKGN